MPSRHIVVVGGSIGGLRTVEALRRKEVDARITLIGDEDEIPYDRPPLSKSVLSGKVEPESVRLTQPADLAALDLDLRLGVRASSLDVAGRKLTLADGEVVAFDDLVIATGASARVPAQFANRPGVHALRTLADAAALRSGLQAGPRLAVLGGGFIGAEVASTARELGLDVTILDIAPALMERALGPVIGKRMTEVARDAGVRFRLEVTVEEILGTDGVDALRLSDGTTVEADLLVLGLGAVPNDAWLQGSGLTIENGVVCDQTLQAAPGIYAVGDVARWHHPTYDRLLRMEHWTAAVEHADAVATTLSGTPTPCEAIPYVWSDQYGNKLQIAGLLETTDEIAYVTDEGLKFVAIAGSNGRQHAAFALNAPGALIRQRMKLVSNPPWPPEAQ